MTTDKLFSIITICLNSGSLLEKTIKSIALQTCQDYEFIIVDGGSVDNTLAIIHRYEKYIASWTSERDRGISHAFNKGIELASGQWINFLNAGDCLAESTTLKEVKDFLGDTPIVTGFARSGDRTIPERFLGNKEHLGIKSRISHQASFVRREVFQKCGGFDETYRLRMDYEFWLRTLAQYPFQMSDCTWVEYDTTGCSRQNSTMGTFFREEKRANTTHQIPYCYWFNRLADYRLLKECLKRSLGKFPLTSA